MNDRIKELAEQAQAQVHEIYNAMEEEPTGDFDYWFDAQFQKIFAELIIKECQRAVDRYIGECCEIASLPKTVLKKHFGVE